VSECPLLTYLLTCLVTYLLTYVLTYSPYLTMYVSGSATTRIQIHSQTERYTDMVVGMYACIIDIQ